MKLTRRVRTRLFGTVAWGITLTIGLSTLQLAFALEFKWFEDERIPIVDALVTLPFGTASVPVDSVGLLEAWTEWQASRPGASWDPALLGARWNHSVDLHSVTLGIHGLAASTTDQVQLLARAVTQSALPTQAEWAEFQPRWKLAVRSRHNSPAESLSQLFQYLVAEGTHFQHGILGRESGSISWNALKAWIDRFWHPDEARITVVGRIASLKANRRLETLFQDWKSASSPVAIDRSSVPIPSHGGRYLLDIQRSESQSWLRVGLRTPPLGHPDTPVLELASALFAGSYQSRLSTQLRETLPLVFSAEGGFWFAPGFGAWSFSVSATREQLPKVLDLVESQWAGWLGPNGGPTPEALEQARRRLLGGLPLLTTTLESQVSRDLLTWRFGLPENVWSERARRLESATAQQVRAAITRWWKPDQTIWILAGPKNTLETAVRSRASWKQARFRSLP